MSAVGQVKLLPRTLLMNHELWAKANTAFTKRFIKQLVAAEGDIKKLNDIDWRREEWVKGWVAGFEAASPTEKVCEEE